MKLKLKNPFKKLGTFIKNRKEAKEFERINAKSKEMKAYADIIQKALRPQPLLMDSSNSIAEFDSEAKGANTPVYFYDFLKEWNNNGSSFVSGGVGSVALSGVDFFDGGDLESTSSRPPLRMGISENIKDIEPKVVIKPKDVFDELETIPNAVSMENLDEKILTFKMREKFIKNNNYAKKEVIDMCTRLENRKKYDQYKDFFERFENTTTEKINKLISKYDLVLKSSDLFIPTFPKEAIDIMEEYQNKVIELCNKKPIFYVIAENSKFKKEFDRNDPILLAQSPFGIYWSILGAWDEEILLLEEL